VAGTIFAIKSSLAAANLVLTFSSGWTTRIFFLNQGSFPELIKTAAAVGDWLREVSCFSQE
jgi:hypothetical protein